MPAVWFIGQASKRSVLESDWQRVGITGRPSAVWEQENGWSIPHNQFTQAQLNLLINDPLFIVGAPDGPRIGMPQGVDYDEEATKGWVVEQIVQRLGTGGTIVSEGELGGGGGNVAADLPVGGMAGQVLAKISDADYDTIWINPPAGGGSGGGGNVPIADYWTRNQTAPVVIISGNAPWPTAAPEGALIVRVSGTGA